MKWVECTDGLLEGIEFDKFNILELPSYFKDSQIEENDHYRIGLHFVVGTCRVTFYHYFNYKDILGLRHVDDDFNKTCIETGYSRYWSMSLNYGRKMNLLDLIQKMEMLGRCDILLNEDKIKEYEIKTHA